ncbi:MAG: type II methionyl aminopeptidase [Nitrososphaerales archaeon]
MSTQSLGVNQNFIRAGEITRQVRKSVESRNWEGKTYLELCNFVEQGIRDSGAEPAFPCNICAGYSAAHYTAEIDDSKTIESRTILKVDIGAHVGGFPADTSVTLCYDEDLFDLVDATRAALTEALKGVKTGSRTSDIGRIVESYAVRRGFIPISNLSGHSLDQYIVHSGTSVPNTWSPSAASFRNDRVYAIEPFLTLKDGSGIVVEGRNANIFSIISRKRLSEPKQNKLMELIWSRCKTLPFAARWFTHEFSKIELDSLLKQLQKMKLVRSYPELLEAKQRPVAQAEHTIATTAAGVVILT